MYKYRSSTIRLEERLSKWFKINKGQEEWCCLSLTLVKMYSIFKDVEGDVCEPGNMTKRLHTLLCFADDELVSAQGYEDLLYITRKLTELFYIYWNVTMRKNEFINLTIKEILIYYYLLIYKSSKKMIEFIKQHEFSIWKYLIWTWIFSGKFCRYSIFFLNL